MAMCGDVTFPSEAPGKDRDRIDGHYRGRVSEHAKTRLRDEIWRLNKKEIYQKFATILFLRSLI